PRLRALDAAHGGSLVAAQTAAVLAGVWPAALLRDVAAVTTADFALHPDGPDHPVDASLDLIATATARVNRPTHGVENADSPRRDVRLTPARRATHPGETCDSPRRDVRLTPARRATHPGETCASPRRDVRLTPARRATHPGETCDSPRRDVRLTPA